MRHHAFWYACPVLLVLTTALIIGFACSDKSTGPQEIFAPEIASISPERGPVGTQVEIRGQGFGNQQGTVNFRDADAAIISWSDSLIIAKVPAGASSGDVIVTVGEISSNGANFEVLHMTITSVEPDSGTVGEEITIRGQYFGSTQGSVSIGDVEAPIESWSDTLITAKVPAGAASGDLIVVVEGNSSNGAHFEVLHMTVASVEPDSGAAGEEITIRGQYFGSTQGSVSIGDIEAPIESWSDTLIIITIPENAETGNLVVSNEFESSNQMMINIISSSASPQGLESTNYVEIVFSGYHQYEQIGYSMGIPTSTDTVYYYRVYEIYNHYEQWPLNWDDDSCYLDYEGVIQEPFVPGQTNVSFSLRVWLSEEGNLIDSLILSCHKSVSYGGLSSDHFGAGMTLKDIALDFSSSDSANYYFEADGSDVENKVLDFNVGSSSTWGTEDNTITTNYIGTDWDNEEYPPEILVIFRQK